MLTIWMKSDEHDHHGILHSAKLLKDILRDRLVTSGLITRQADPATRRQNVIRLTKAGHAKIDPIHECWSSVDDEILNILGREEAGVFSSYRAASEKVWVVILLAPKPNKPVSRANTSGARTARRFNYDDVS